MVGAVQPFTMTSPERILALREAVRHIVRHKVPGAIVECGVWKGGSMMATARTLLALGQKRNLFLFDTFCGMTTPEAIDRDLAGHPAADLLNAPSPSALIRAASPLDEVQQNMASTGYDPALVKYVVGPVEETVPAQAPDQIALLRLDTDWYASTAHELQHLYPRLAAGGILIIDDYGHWQGARRAVDEFLAETRTPLFLHRIDYTGRIGVKP
jgi:cephalosporin hydroxylase